MIDYHYLIYEVSTIVQSLNIQPFSLLSHVGVGIPEMAKIGQRLSIPLQKAKWRLETVDFLMIPRKCTHGTQYDPHC